MWQTAFAKLAQSWPERGHDGLDRSAASSPQTRLTRWARFWHSPAPAFLAKSVGKPQDRPCHNTGRSARARGKPPSGFPGAIVPPAALGLGSLFASGCRAVAVLPHTRGWRRSFHPRSFCRDGGGPISRPVERRIVLWIRGGGVDRKFVCRTLGRGAGTRD